MVPGKCTIFRLYFYKKKKDKGDLEMKKYLIADTKCEYIQNEHCRNFIGGYPSLPENIALPVCSLCGSEQTFFFQIAFSKNHCWEGHSLSAFLCTCCADENYLIPEMLKVELKDADIPAGFLEKYQINFRFLVFPTESGSIRTDYAPKVKFQPLSVKKSIFSLKNDIKIDSKPTWLSGDESPLSYNSTGKMIFLCQIPPNYRFELVTGAPSQITLDLGGNSTESVHRYYEYFIGNSVYLFGTENPKHHLVYVITQVE